MKMEKDNGCKAKNLLFKKKLENKFESFMQQEILKISRTKQFSD